MISGLKLKISAIILIVCIASVATYWYLSPEQTGNDGDETKLTALEALNFTLSYIEFKYETFNLSTIRDYSYSSVENMPDWEITYVIKNDGHVIYERMGVFFNGTFYLDTSSYELDEVLSWYYPWDIRGFEVGLLRIDSDEVMEIIKSRVENETWYDSYEYFSLHLEGSLSNPATPTWIGKFYEPDDWHYIKINATTGEIVDYYVPYNSSEIYIDLGNISNGFDGANFTAFEGLFLSNYHIESKYQKFNLSKIYMSRNETGYCNSWNYTYVINDVTNEVVHESVTVYANGTCAWYNRIYEMDDLRMGEYHGPVDIHGFEIGLLKIDSDEVMEIIRNRAQNETWWNDRTNFVLELAPEDPDYFSITNPVWIGEFTADKYYTFIVNATTGDIVDYSS